MLSNLGQLYRYDLAAAYRPLPNDDGTFHNRRLDVFLSGLDTGLRAWLVHAGGRLAGFAMVRTADDGTHSVADFFVVRALRRSGVGRTAAREVLAMFPGPWRIAFQRYNPGAGRGPPAGHVAHLHDVPAGGPVTVRRAPLPFRHPVQLTSLHLGRRSSSTVCCTVATQEEPMSTKKLTDVAESAEVAPVAETGSGMVVESLVEDVSIDGMCGVY